MIIFSWTLTPNQVLALKSVAAYHRRYAECARKKQVPDQDEHRLDMYGIGHWSTACRHLFKEGFIVHKEVPLEGWESKSGKYPSLKNVRQAWEITAKGLLVLQLAEIEVGEQSRLLKVDKLELKLLEDAV